MMSNEKLLEGSRKKASKDRLIEPFTD